MEEKRTTAAAVSLERDPLYERVLDRLGWAATYALPAVASALVIYACFPLLQGEQSVAWDEMFHQATERLTAETIHSGRNPFGLLPAMFGLPAFRFYQSLQYLLAAALQIATGLAPVTIHNFMIVGLFAATPWAYRRFCLALGLTPAAAGVGGLLSICSINGTSASFESFFECAFLTQVLASFLLPLALASLATLIREGRGMVCAGVLMALTMLAHAMYAVYASLAALLLVVVFLPTKSKIWLRLVAAAAIAFVLALGWMGPFVHYQSVDKPVTDAVARADRSIWFTGLTPAEMGRYLVGGRLLDGGPMDGSHDAIIESKINMTPTRTTRFPFLTLLTGVGLLFALVGFRRQVNRYLVAGLSLGLLLLLGFDDLQFLFRLPLISKIQAFRVTYLIELFAMALAGHGAASLGALVVRWFAKGAASMALKTLTAAIAIAAVVGFWISTEQVASKLLDTWDLKPFERVQQTLAKAGSADRQQRLLVKFRRPGRKFRFALEHWLEANGRYRATCSHWTSLSPTVNLHLCGPLGAPWRAPQFARLFGVRYLVVGRDDRDAFVGETSPLREEYRHLGRVGRLSVIEDRRAAMLHEIPGRRVLVIATPAQWYWLTKDWVSRRANAVADPRTPWPLLAPAAALENRALLEAVDAVMYLDDHNLDRDRPALEAIAASGKPLALGRPIEGLDGRVFDKNSPPWVKVLARGGRDPANTEIERLDRADVPDRLRYRVAAASPTLLVLSMQHFEGWQARAGDQPLTVFAAGPDLVGVIVPAGEHQLEFSYEWSSLETSTFWISIIGWLAAIGFGLFLAGRRGWRFVEQRRKKRP